MEIAYRTIDASNYVAIQPPSSLGRPVRLEWLSISQLVIDPAYQREISFIGRRNVRRIASNFSWSMFAPVIVAAAGGNRFAIVDGQHRTTAAVLCGVEKVPCAIIEAERGEQAAAFRAINGNITRLSSMQVHAAAVVAGEARALRVQRVCDAADVVLCRYPKPWDKIEVGETMAVVVVRRAIEKFGDDCVITALRAIRDSGDGNPGLLRGPVIYGTAEVLADHPEWRESGGALIEAFDEIDLAEMLQDAGSAAARLKGSSVTDQFEARLVAALELQFKRRGKRRA